MLRTVRTAATVAALAAAALVTIPTLAEADATAGAPTPVISCYGHCQIADGSNYNAGRDNIIGSGGLGGAPDAGLTITKLAITAAPSMYWTMHRVSMSGGGVRYPTDIYPGAGYPDIISYDASAASYRGPDETLQITVDGAGVVDCSATAASAAR